MMERVVRGAGVAAYVALAALGFLLPWQPRVFWTMVLPLIPIGFVLAGFHTWRRVCPLAAFGEIGRRFNRGKKQRRVPRALERSFFVLTFTVMLVMLSLRLVVTNGDGPALSALLIGLALAAAVTNLMFTGKTWCNFLCPVGLVERIYTEPASLRAGPTSQCVRCTACKLHCPDIDEENAYWQDLDAPARRLAYTAFPGLVLGFYTYYWLRAGSWEAYFDGRWTHEPAHALAAGWFFWPAVPALVAAPLTLVAFAAASYGLFLGVEKLLARWEPDPALLRHRVLALAAFAAFNLFYLFAGAPSLRRLAGATQLVGFLVPVVASLALVGRYRRTRERYLQEKGASKLLKKWPWPEAPPQDPAQVFVLFKAREQARETNLAAYRDATREMLADGLVGRGELRLLEQFRTQLGITEREHTRMLAELDESERRLFDPSSVEERVQREAYAEALAELLLRNAAEHDLEALRLDYNIAPAVHDAVVRELRAGSGTLHAKAQAALTHAEALRADLAALPAGPGPAELLAYALRCATLHAARRALDALAAATEPARVAALHAGLFSRERHDRSIAAAELRALPAEAAPGLADLLLDPDPAPVAGTCAAALARLVTSPDPFVRAGAWHAAPELGDAELLARAAAALGDPHPLVRESAVRAAAGSPALEPLREDPDPAVRRAATDALDSGGRARRGFAALTTVERMLYLHRVALFADLEPPDLYELSALASELTVAPLVPICRQGERGDNLFVIVSGRAQVVAQSNGGETVLGVRGPGEVLGELSLIDGSPRSATVRCERLPVRLLRIDGRGFRARFLHRSDITQTLLQTLSRRMREASSGR